jgi:hypothetical protein
MSILKERASGRRDDGLPCCRIICRFVVAS